jgi:hypothetical protein
VEKRAVVATLSTVIFDDMGRGEQLAAKLELEGASAIGEQSEVANPLKAAWESVEEETASKLVSGEGHQAVVGMVAVVLPGEGDEAVFKLEQAMV